MTRVDIRRNGAALAMGVLATLLLLAGCREESGNQQQTNNGEAQSEASPSPSPVSSPGDLPRPSGPVTFNDITAKAGIRFKHNSGAFGKKYLPETMGPGCAFLDYDNDGWQDILLVNSSNWPEHKGPHSYLALYHNNKDGTFSDVTRQAGLATEMYGLGVAIGDFDNDGFDDIYITCVGSNHLFHNQGNGTFKDVTAKAGVASSGFSTSAVWFDYDNDGRLDLFVCHYVDWSPEKDQSCTLDGKNKSYCTPQSYNGESSRLYHNLGNGRFEDVTRKAGLEDPTGKALGVAMLDYNDDGRMDLFVACDTEPNKLYKNNGNGTFTDEALTAGVAFSQNGQARAGMGVDAADYDESGRTSVVIGNFTNESMSLYHNDGNGLFTDDAQSSGIGKRSIQSLTFATFFFDYDLDGLLDIFAANGHVSDDISIVQPSVKYAQPPHLFRNTGRKGFVDMVSKLGPFLQRPIVGRGAAYGDFDNDGDLDLLITANNGAARLLRNENGNQNDLLRIKLVGTKSNRDGIGARVTLQGQNGAKQDALVKTGSSYCSQSELPVTFGLGKAQEEYRLRIVWPGGHIDQVNGLKPNQSIVLQEGKGVISAEPIVFARPEPVSPQQ